MTKDRIIEQELDLALAAEIQSALLPKGCPVDCPHQVAAARNRMCGRVGGDFYDFIRINEEQIGLIVGDVVGHGVRASLMMAQVMGFLRSGSAHLSRPLVLTKELNRMLLDLGDKTGSVLPCTLFYAVIDAPSGLCLYVNAGHPRPFVCDKEKCEVFPGGSRNILLGVEEFEPEESCYTFTPGQRFVLYTDGITDAVNPHNDRFGETRLHETINAHANNEPEICADAVIKALDEFRQDTPPPDDETIIVIDRV